MYDHIRYLGRSFLSGGLVFTLLLCALSPPPAHAQSDIAVGNFSRQEDGGPLPPGWGPLTFSKIPHHTSYTLVKDEGTTVIKATSLESASGIVRKISIDPRTFPIISWRWKAMNILEHGDITKKSGDDYPARLYITFARAPDTLTMFERIKYETARIVYGEYPPTATLAYIWANHAPMETIAPNPNTDRVRMIVLRSGTAFLNTWITERRNIIEDYRKAFGEDPPPISGVALMTDSDNTGSAATAFYGDIFFSIR